MAINVKVVKQSETEYEVFYTFYFSHKKQDAGLLKLNKKDEGGELIKNVSRLADKCAILAVKKYRLEHPDEGYPEEVYWES